MNVSPVSFGKTVRVNATSDVAFDIARLANEKKVSKSEKSAQKEVKAIFDDVSFAPAQVTTYTNRWGEEEVYIVSGKESKKIDLLNEQIATGIIQAGDSLLPLGKSEKFKKSLDRQYNRYLNQKRDFLLDSATNFSISAIYNPQKTRVKSVSREYDSVYAVSGTEQQIEEMKKIIKKTNGKATILDATELYTQGLTNGLCNAAASQGKKINFVITGKEATDKVSFMDYGWSSLNGISKRIQKFISLDNVKDKVRPIQEAMEYDTKKGIK